MPAPTRKNSKIKAWTVYEPLLGLSGDLWPIHLKPKPDELLSSWLIRFAHAHLIKAETICTMLIKRQSPIWNRDVDRMAPDTLLENLCRVTGTTPEQAWNTTLAAYEGWLSEKVNCHGSSRWILPLGIYHRDRTRPSLMYCPQCLAEPDGKYFRRTWRLSWATVCTKHGCLLVDQCPGCGAPIEPHRSDMISRQVLPNANTFITCHHCSKFLSRAAILPADTSVISFQRKLEATLHDGFLDWAGNPNLHSVLFFNGLRAILAGITTRRATRNQQDSLIARVRGAEFERCSLSDRYGLMQILALLLCKWPDSFQKYVAEHRIRFSDLNSCVTDPAYWYATVLQKMSLAQPRLLEAEALAILDVARRKGLKTDAQALRKFSGRNVSRFPSINGRKHMSDDDYEQYMANIDHQIAGTMDKKKRLLYLRTKFMFAAARQFKLNHEQLVRLTMDDVRKRVPEIPEVCFFIEPRSREQAAAWVAWYWDKVRPFLSPNQAEKLVFTGINSGSGMTARCVGIWLTKARNSLDFIK